MTARLRRACLSLALACGTAALAQTPPSASAGDTARKAPAQPAAPAIAVSGLLFGNYQYQTHEANRDFNQFLLERAYVNVRANLGEGLSTRITTDVFQSGDANGWTIRLKYGYLQYDRTRRGWTSSTRGGMLHNVVVEHIEQHWPRWLSQVATERSGYHTSADVGVAEMVTLPNKLGEVYSTIVNGSSFSRRETDRFKDVGLRVSLTPLARSTTGLLSTFVVTGWFSEGASASRFVQGGAGQVGPVRQGLNKDRYGVFAGLRDPRLAAGVEYAARQEQDETGSNTLLAPRVVSDVTGSIRAGFAVVRPLAFVNASGKSRFALVGRYDDVRPGTTRALVDADERSHFLVAGLILDATSRLSLAFDYQEQLARRNLIPEFKTYFAHFQVTF